MKIALVNPNWSFTGSIYFGCREPHLPLEYGYAKALLERDGHQVDIVDGQLHAGTAGSPVPECRVGPVEREELVRRVAAFAPQMTVVTTAPSYLFWRCAPPELRVPMQAVRDLRPVGGVMVAVGPHASSTPATTLRKLAVDVAVMGECEEILPMLAEALADERLLAVPSVCYWREGEPFVQGAPAAVRMETLPALRWPVESIQAHHHHHHRFDAPPRGPGAEMEVSRGCPYRCTFCAKENFRNKYRKRPLAVVLEELDGLIAAGVEYVYFIDEIFLPDVELLEALASRPMQFGVQTRIDLWDEPMLAALGRAGCVSIEAGVESITDAGRRALDKRCKLSTEQLSERLIYAKRQVPFVQANLLMTPVDDPAAIETWRLFLREHGVWANAPVPLFPYPGSPDYTLRWGAPDDRAWERAHGHYLESFAQFSDIQEGRPLPLSVLEHEAELQLC